MPPACSTGRLSRQLPWWFGAGIKEFDAQLVIGVAHYGADDLRPDGWIVLRPTDPARRDERDVDVREFVSIDKPEADTERVVTYHTRSNLGKWW